MRNEWRSLASREQRLRWARGQAGFAEATDAADAMGVSRSTYFGHENGSRGFSRHAERYARFYRVSLEWLLTGRREPKPHIDGFEEGESARYSAAPMSVPIVGKAGAGPEGAVYFAEGSGEMGEAPAPPTWTKSTVALEVSGTSMRPLAYEGWLIYYDDRRSNISSDMIGQPCVLGLASGHTVIKTPYRGSKPGMFNLESTNPSVDTMRDQRIKWAALVTAIVPRVPARRLRSAAKGSVSL